MILGLMKNHEGNENWFSSLIGFFYEHGIGDTYIVDKQMSLKFYLSSIIERNEKLVSVYQILNIIIAKYLLSFYYYKDIISNKREREFSGNVHEISVPQNQFEKFNGLEINICKDEINIIEIYFELLNNNLINPVKEQIDYYKKKELADQNYLGYCYQYGIEKEKDEFKAFELYLKSAKGGNLDAQNNLGYCYYYGIGIEKSEKKAFESYLKAANEGNLCAQYNLGNFYQDGFGILKDKAFLWYMKVA